MDFGAELYAVVFNNPLGLTRDTSLGQSDNATTATTTPSVSAYTSGMFDAGRKSAIITLAAVTGVGTPTGVAFASSVNPYSGVNANAIDIQPSGEYAFLFHVIGGNQVYPYTTTWALTGTQTTGSPQNLGMHAYTFQMI